MYALHPVKPTRQARVALQSIKTMVGSLGSSIYLAKLLDWQREQKLMLSARSKYPPTNAGVSERSNKRGRYLVAKKNADSTLGARTSFRRLQPYLPIPLRLPSTTLLSFSKDTFNSPRGRLRGPGLCRTQTSFPKRQF